MPRELTRAQRRNLDSRRSSDPYLFLLTVTHPMLATPLRIAKNAEAVASQGFTFAKGWFEVDVPADRSEPPQGRLSVPNVDREIAAIVLGLRTAPRIRLQAVLASDPDSVIEDYNHLYLREITGDARVLSGRLDSWRAVTEPWPARLATQARFPAVWVQ